MGLYACAHTDNSFLSCVTGWWLSKSLWKPLWECYDYMKSNTAYVPLFHSQAIYFHFHSCIKTPLPELNNLLKSSSAVKKQSDSQLLSSPRGLCLVRMSSCRIQLTEADRLEHKKRRREEEVVEEVQELCLCACVCVFGGNCSQGGGRGQTEEWVWGEGERGQWPGSCDLHTEIPSGKRGWAWRSSIQAKGHDLTLHIMSTNQFTKKLFTNTTNHHLPFAHLPHPSPYKLSPIYWFKMMETNDSNLLLDHRLSSRRGP